MNFKQLAEHLQPYLSNILIEICPGGHQEGREYKAGSIYGGQGDSFSFNIDTQKWADFAHSGHAGGDIISLYAAVRGLKPLQAAQELASQYGFKTETVITNNPPSGIHPKYGKPERIYIYKNSDLTSYMAVYRYKLPELNSKGKHKKHFSQWHFDKNTSKWVAKKPPNGYILYNLEQIMTYADKKIVICEGEKSAEAITRILSPNIYIPSCWPGGSSHKNIDQTNMMPLSGRDVILWADNDQEGLSAMQHLAARIAHIVKSLTVVNPLPEDPESYDAADLAAEHQDQNIINDWIKKRAKKLKSSTEVVSTVSPRAEEQLPVDDFNHASAVIRWQEYNLQMASQYKVDEHEENVFRILQRHPTLKNSYYFDEFENKYMSTFQNTKPEPANEDECIKIKMLLQREFRFSKVSTAAVKSAMRLYLKTVPRRNFTAEQLAKLEWDKTPRVDTFFMDIYGADDNEYNRAASRIFWLQIANRVVNPGCKVDIMLILEGAQGIRKSTSLRTIATPEYFTEAGSDISKKDFFIKLKSKMIVEFGELNTFSKADQNQLKEVISTQVDQYRDLFQPEDTPHPRTCVFVGTTNDRHYLKDETGARRYMPVECQSVDIDKLTEFRDQYFAEAYSRIGEDYWTFPVDAHKQITDERSIDFKDDDPWFNVVEYYSVGKSTFDITEFLTTGVNENGIGMNLDRVSLKEKRRVAIILRQIGWVNTVKKDPNGKSYKIWEKNTDLKITDCLNENKKVKNYAPQRGDNEK